MANENLIDGTVPSRRALLKGAVAAGVGVAVYSAPVVSVVPAYATHGLSSFTDVTATQCVWWSPNRSGGDGEWDDDGVVGATAVAGFGSRTASATYTVAGQTVTVTFAGSPNNEDASGTPPLDFTSYSGSNNGVDITLDNADCEMLVSETACDRCDPASAIAPPEVWTAANPWQGVQTINYKSGRHGSAKLGTKGDNDRCKWSLRFVIRCRP